MDKQLKSKKIKNTWITGGFLLILVAAGIYYLTTFAHSYGTLRISANRIVIDTVTEGIFQDELLLQGVLKPSEAEHITFPDHVQIEKISVFHGEHISCGDSIAIIKYIGYDSVFKRRVSEQILAALGDSEFPDVEKIKAKYHQALESMSGEEVNAIIKGFSEPDKYNLPKNFLSELEAYDINFHEDLLDDLNKHITVQYITAHHSGRIYIKESPENNRNNEKTLIFSGKSLIAEAVIDKNNLQRLQKDLESSIIISHDTFPAYTTDIKAEGNKLHGRVRYHFSQKTPGYNNAYKEVKILTPLGSTENVCLLPTGSFLQYTGGKWVYVVNGDKAEKREIEIGRRNTKFIEVLYGLEKDERVITSGYDATNQADEFLIVKDVP